ncbi:hypothetical protein ADL26_17775 [Thermoactinomyces vulgaris]|jgi:hypothetical protein|nr:hypothetical protein ADL26_17775 [Thermoactinomyces vulgaris]
MLRYEYDKQKLNMQEKANGNDVEFDIRCLDGALVEAIKRVQELFEDNDVHTDVLFYAYPNHEYRVIVRQDYYVDFILALMKHRVLQRVEWMT